jgi:hypothetical protein
VARPGVPCAASIAREVRHGAARMEVGRMKPPRPGGTPCPRPNNAGALTSPPGRDFENHAPRPPITARRDPLMRGRWVGHVFIEPNHGASGGCTAGGRCLTFGPKS